MCGIVGAVSGTTAGTPPSVAVLDGLARLEYRGSDSAGGAVVSDGAVAVRKKAGKLGGLPEPPERSPLPGTRVAIVLARWAAPCAHPHLSDDGRVAVIHNGIIENFAALRAELEADGATFASETDTEVVAHLLTRAYAGDLTAAMLAVTARLEGAFTLLALHADHPGTIVAARRNSPLVVGLGDGANYLGSDVAAFVAQTKSALEVDQDQVVTITADSVSVVDAQGNPVEPRAFTVAWDAEAAVKGGYDSFMDKEIHDQPQAVADTLLGRTDELGHLQLDELRIDEAILRSID